MEKGVLKYVEYDGEQSEPIRVDRDRESQTRVKETRRKSRENSGFNSYAPNLSIVHGSAAKNQVESLCDEAPRTRNVRKQVCKDIDS